jgi:putative redox protein
MIQGANAQGATRTVLRNDAMSLLSDTSPPVGAGAGFRPHELLEAALASCIGITIRMVALERRLPLHDVRVAVELDRAQHRTVFRTRIGLDGPLAEKERALLLATARRCPVRKTLSKPLAFEEATTAP